MQWIAKCTSSYPSFSWHERCHTSVYVAYVRRWDLADAPGTNLSAHVALVLDLMTLYGWETDGSAAGVKSGLAAASLTTKRSLFSKKKRGNLTASSFSLKRWAEVSLSSISAFENTKTSVTGGKLNLKLWNQEAELYQLSASSTLLEIWAHVVAA